MNQLTTIQHGWLKLADIKTALFDQLQRAELDVQSQLVEMDAMPLETLQENIKSAKGIYNDAKSKRLDFTKMMDEKLISPSMEFEKRMDAVIKTASARELELRKIEAEKVSRENEYLNEVAAFKAHITNEWFRLAHEYRLNLERGIRASYRNCLESKVPVDQIPQMKDDCARIISLFKLPEFQKFERKLISDGQAKEIYDSIDKYDSKDDLKRAIDLIDDVWATYAHDLENAEGAIKAIEDQAKQRENELQKELNAEIATNTLIAKAETIAIDGPKIKKEIKIVVVESEQWAMLVMTNFLKNWQHCNKYVRVKSWEKLSIGQMAGALAKHISETGETFQGLKTEEVCK